MESSDRIFLGFVFKNPRDVCQVIIEMLDEFKVDARLGGKDDRMIYLPFIQYREIIWPGGKTSLCETLLKADALLVNHLGVEIKKLPAKVKEELVVMGNDMTGNYYSVLWSIEEDIVIFSSGDHKFSRSLSWLQDELNELLYTKYPKYPRDGSILHLIKNQIPDAIIDMIRKEYVVSDIEYWNRCLKVYK